MDFSSIGPSIADALTDKSPGPTLGLTLGALGLALLLTLGPAWPLTRHLVTVSHEASHAIMALLSGRRLSAIRLNFDSSGETVSAGVKKGGLGLALTLLAGYPGPALMGLALTYALTESRAGWAMVAILTLLLGVALLLRSLWGMLVVLVLFATSWLALSFQPVVQVFGLLLLALILLIGSLRTEIEVGSSLRQGKGSDPDQLQELSKIVPAEAWLALMLGISCVAAWASFTLLY